MSRFLLSFFFVFLWAVLLLSCASDPAPKKENSSSALPSVSKDIYMTESLERLQGIWTDSLNKNRTIRINKNVFYEKRPGSEESVYKIEAYQNCPNYCGDQKSKVSLFSCFILKTEKTAECFALFKITDNEMQFTAMAGKPETQYFIKAN